MPPLGTADRPLRVAVVGAGPAGLYATEALVKKPDLVTEVDVFERFPTPFGLVRDGSRPTTSPSRRWPGCWSGSWPIRGCGCSERHLRGRPPPPGPQAPLRPDPLRRRRPGRPAHEHPRRGPAQQHPGDRVRGLVQRPSRLPRPARRPRRRAGGRRQRQRGHGRGPHPGHRPEAGHDRHGRPRPGGAAGAGSARSWSWGAGARPRRPSPPRAQGAGEAARGGRGRRPGQHRARPGQPDRGRGGPRPGPI